MQGPHTSFTGKSEGAPRSKVSFHSQTTTLTVWSLIPSFFFGSFMNLTSMKGSTLPPHDFLLYMPLDFGSACCPCVTHGPAFSSYLHFWVSLSDSVTSIAATAVTVVNSSRARLRSRAFILPRCEASWRSWRRAWGFTALQAEGCGSSRVGDSVFPSIPGPRRVMGVGSCLVVDV